jgi:preprotein translocase subunit SecF
MITIIDKRRWLFLASGILLILSIAALIISSIKFGPPFYLDLASAEEAQATGLVLLIVLVVASAFAWWSLRRADKAVRYGICVAAVLLHNVIITSGFYALMFIIAGWRNDILFFVALLAMAGFSIQDTTTISRRIHENALKHKEEPYGTSISRSILETATSTLITRLCAAFVAVTLVVAGGPSLRPFAATLLVGAIAETYSAIFITASLLAAWDAAAARRATRTAATSVT